MEINDKLEATIKFDGRYLNIRVPTMSQMRVMTRYLVSTDVCEKFREFARIRPIQTILDIGANVGFLSILLSTAFPKASIYAMEPSLINCEYLRHNCKEFPNVSIIKKGAYNKAGHARLASPSEDQRHIAKWNANTGQLSLYGRGTDEESVELVRIDDLFDNVDFIKIDVEGAELDVLRGGERLLVECRPILLIELRDDTQCMAGRSAAHVTSYLKNLGYTVSGCFEQDVIFTHRER
jgi:FkbM family methyltransferase